MDLMEIQGIWGPTAKWRKRKHYMPTEPVPFHGQMPQRGQYIGTYSPVGSAIVLAADTIYYVPILIPYPMTLDLLGVYITTIEAGKFVKIGIYPMNRGVIGDLIDSVDPISLGVADLQTGSIQVALAAGAYMFAVLSNATGTGAVRKNSVLLPLLPDSSGVGSLVSNHYQESLAYASGLPTSPGTLTITTADSPRIITRRMA